MSALDELYHGLFVTALEGGIGYWSECVGYHWSNADGSDDVGGFNALIIETDAIDDPESVPEWVIDRAVIAKGYRLATTVWRDGLTWSSAKPPVVVGPDTDWDYDAGDADLIVQLGLFGELVYG